MAEIKMKNFVINVGGKTYKMIGSRLEDICEELGISEDRFVEILSRDAYCPTLSAAPTSSTLTYIDTDGSTNHFHVGQLCRWAEGSGYRLAVCKDATETSVAWYILPDVSLFATKTDVSNAVANLVNGAPETLDTIGEISTALKNNKDIVDVLNNSISGKQDKMLKFTNVTASVWVADSTFPDFGFRCDIACSGVTDAMFASIAFANEQAMSGAYSPFCETRTNVVSIWSTQNVPITIPSIIIHK